VAYELIYSSIDPEMYMNVTEILSWTQSKVASGSRASQYPMSSYPHP
jgi:hypothetical protein